MFYMPSSPVTTITQGAAYRRIWDRAAEEVEDESEEKDED